MAYFPKIKGVIKKHGQLNESGNEKVYIEQPPLISTTNASGVADPLCFHATGDGWLSDRLCAYPQEIRLELEAPAEIHKVEFETEKHFAPTSVEIRLSTSHSAFAQGYGEHFGLIEGVGKRSVSSFGLTSGVIHLLIHSPVHTAENPYGQVRIRAVHLWGRLSRAKLDPVVPSVTRTIDSEGRQIERALLDCGISLDLVPHTAGFNVDNTTAVVMEELRQAQRGYLDSGRLGEVQQMANDLEKLQIYGSRVRELEVESKKLFECGALEPATLLEAEFDALIDVRLQIAAYWFLPFWEREVSLEPPGPSANELAAQVTSLQRELAAALKKAKNSAELLPTVPFSVIMSDDCTKNANDPIDDGAGVGALLEDLCPMLEHVSEQLVASLGPHQLKQEDEHLLNSMSKLSQKVAPRQLKQEVNSMSVHLSSHVHPDPKLDRAVVSHKLKQEDEQLQSLLSRHTSTRVSSESALDHGVASRQRTQENDNVCNSMPLSRSTPVSPQSAHDQRDALSPTPLRAPSHSNDHLAPGQRVYVLTTGAVEEEAPQRHSMPARNAPSQGRLPTDRQNTLGAMCPTSVLSTGPPRTPSFSPNHDINHEFKDLGVALNVLQKHLTELEHALPTTGAVANGDLPNALHILQKQLAGLEKALPGARSRPGTSVSLAALQANPGSGEARDDKAGTHDSSASFNADPISREVTGSCGPDALFSEEMVADGRWDPTTLVDGHVSPRSAKVIEDSGHVLGRVCAVGMTGEWRLQVFLLDIIGQHLDQLVRVLPGWVQPLHLWHSLCGLVEISLTRKYVQLQLASLCLLTAALTTNVSWEGGPVVDMLPVKDALAPVRRFAGPLFMLLGNTNQRVASLAEDASAQLALKLGPLSCFPMLAQPHESLSPPKKLELKQLPWRHVEGRITACVRAVQILGPPTITEGAYSIEALMPLAKHGLHHSMQEVRHASVDLLAQLYSYVKDRLLAFLKDVPPNLVALINQRFAEIDATGSTDEIDIEAEGEENVSPER